MNRHIHSITILIITGVIVILAGAAGCEGIRKQLFPTEDEKILNAEAKTAEDHLNKADIYYKRGNYKQALKEYKNAMHKDSYNAKAYLGIGKVYFQEDLQSVAVENLEQSIVYDPSEPEAYAFLAASLYAQEKLDEVVKTCNEGLLIDASYPYLYLWRGRAYEDLNEIDKAVHDYEKIIVLDPDFEMMYGVRNRLGGLYQKQGDLDACLFQWQKAYELQPNEIMEMKIKFVKELIINSSSM